MFVIALGIRYTAFVPGFRLHYLILHFAMKKILFLLAFLVFPSLVHATEGGSVTEEEDVTLTLEETVTLTFSTKDGDPEKVSGGARQGVLFTLNNNFSQLTRLDVACDGVVNPPSFGAFNLESISVKVLSSGSWDVATGAYLIEDEHNTVLAHATNTITRAAGGETVTFQFDNVVLNPNVAYKLFFVKAVDIDNVKIAVGTAMNANYQVTRQIETHYFDDDDNSECGVATGINATTAPYYAPMVTIKGTVLVPEPATATLSLLALAGLAARRRRK